MKPLILIKIGGSSIDAAIKEIPSVTKKFQIVIVHGAGLQIDKALAKEGINTEKIDGLRPTSEKCLKVVRFQLEKANKIIVNELNKQGVKAVSIENAFSAKQKSKELGYVGTITAVNASELKESLKNNQVPVVIPLGFDKDQAYNINADTAASLLALKLKPESLVFLNEEGGVRNANGAIIKEIHPEDLKKLVGDGILSGGMKLKLEEAYKALKKIKTRINVCSSSSMKNDMNGTKVIL